MLYSGHAWTDKKSPIIGEQTRAWSKFAKWRSRAESPVALLARFAFSHAFGGACVFIGPSHRFLIRPGSRNCRQPRWVLPRKFPRRGLLRYLGRYLGRWCRQTETHKDR